MEALDKSKLKISGNSTSLARWDSRLGFTFKPFIATMPSLTKDGGMIPLMAVTIIRVYPLAFKHRERNMGMDTWLEAEEFKMQEDWKVSAHYVSISNRANVLL